MSKNNTCTERALLQNNRANSALFIPAQLYPKSRILVKSSSSLLSERPRVLEHLSLNATCLKAISSSLENPKDRYQYQYQHQVKLSNACPICTQTRRQNSPAAEKARMPKKFNSGRSTHRALEHLEQQNFQAPPDKPQLFFVEAKARAAHTAHSTAYNYNSTKHLLLFLLALQAFSSQPLRLNFWSNF